MNISERLVAWVLIIASIIVVLAILLSGMPVYAKQDRSCARGLRDTLDARAIKQVCDVRQKIGPNEYGWICENPVSGKIARSTTKGQGSRYQSGVVCE